MLVLAGGAVGPVAGAERDLAEAEMVAEFGPLGVGRLAVFLAGPLAAAAGDELPVVADHLGRVDGDVALSGVQVKVAQELGSDMDRQAAVNGLGGEDPAKIMGGEPQRGAV